jgi:hypothetical protein
LNGRKGDGEEGKKLHLSGRGQTSSSSGGGTLAPREEEQCKWPFGEWLFKYIGGLSRKGRADCSMMGGTHSFEGEEGGGGRRDGPTAPRINAPPTAADV